MKKNMLMFGSVLAISTTAFSAESLFMREHLNTSFKERPGIVACMKDIVTIPKRDDVIADVISPNENHHGLNFAEVTKQIFGNNYWMPQQTVFDDSRIEDLLAGYKPQLQDIDGYNIFLANILYVSGSQFYNQTKNPEFLEYASSIGHAGAQYAMFSIALKSKKTTEARNYLLSAAAQKNTEALLKLSDVYQGGYQHLFEGFSKDLEMSRKLCQEAAFLGNNAARFRIEVATLTEGFFGSQMNYQEGVRKAKELADQGNKRAQEFIAAIMRSSGDSLMEGNELITYEDLVFLRQHLGWKDESDE